MQNQEEKKKSKLDIVLEALRDIFAPNLVALSGAGILQGITILLLTFGLATPGAAEEFLLTRISDAVFYFLPVLLAYSSAKVFKTNAVLAASTALFLLHPDVTQAMELFPTSDFFGIPLYPGNYPSSVIPIILIVWGQSYIERFVVRILPPLLRGVFLPLLVLSLTGLLAITLLGPIGNVVGSLLGAVIGFLNQYANWLVTTLLGAFGLFFVMAGGHYSLFAVVTQTLATVGYDSFMAPGLLPSNLALAGACAAVIFKTRNDKYKAYNVSATVTGILGVSQPGLYGTALPIKKVMRGAIIGGGIGGLYAGLTGFVSYALVNPGLAALPAFISPDGTWGNLLHAVITMVLAFGVAFVLTYVGEFHDLPAAEINQLIAEE